MNKVRQMNKYFKEARWSYFIFMIIICIQSSVIGQLRLNAYVIDCSPYGRLIELGGAIACDTGNFIGWWYEWGDGTISSSAFATYHRYENPGTYEIIVKGYDDHGNSKTVSVTHEVLPTPITDVNDVYLSEYFIGFPGGEDTKLVEITAVDASGHIIPITERDVQFYVPTYNSVTSNINTQLNGSQLIISPSESFNKTICIGYVYVFVDGVEAKQPLTVIINSNEATYGSLVGEYAVTYLPQMFFDMSEMPEQDYVKILDLGYQMGNWSVRELLYEAGRMLYGITYDPPVNGVSGNPLRIGDSAVPIDGIPRVGLILHEMNHAFQSLPICFRRFGTPGAFYKETLSEWVKQFTYHMILSEHGQEISQTAYEILETSRDESRELHHRWYEQYIEKGCPFDYSVTLYGSQPLVHLIYEYSNVFGWDRIRQFMDHFQYNYVPDLARIFTIYGGIDIIENKVTMMAAVLSSTFHIDVRPDFDRLNFPINVELYDDLMQLFTVADINFYDYAVFAEEFATK